MFTRRSAGRSWLYIGMVASSLCLLPGCWEATCDVDNIQVRGSEEIVSQTEAALALLKESAPDAYQRAQEYIGAIAEGPRSTMDASRTPPTFWVNGETAFYSVTWYACVIAHEATHSKLYHECLEAHGGPVPYDAWGSFEAERTCIEFQMDVAERIGAPQYEIDHLAAQDGTHGDTNGNGQTDIMDWLLIDW